MSRITWNNVGERIYEAGVNQTVLYPQDTGGTYPLGVAWNGIISINESPSGAESSPIYADNIKYANIVGTEEYGCSIEAYTYPDEFAECDGSAEVAAGVFAGQQTRKPFGLCYKTLIGNDVDAENHGYKLHIVWGCLAAPSEKGHSSINENVETSTFSWEITTTPVAIPGFKPTACYTINSTKTNAAKLAELETILYGKDAVEAVGTVGDTGYVAGTDAVVARLPLPAEIMTLMTVAAG